MAEQRPVYINLDAMPYWSGPDQPSKQALMYWSASDDDLVRYVYGNQGHLFAEDAVVFKTWTPEQGDHLYIRRDVGTRIHGSWETPVVYDQSNPTWLNPVHVNIEDLPPLPPVDILGNTRTVSVKGYWLTKEDVETIATALEDHAERMLSQQEATHDYTPNELRDADRRRGSVRRALKLEDEK